MTVYNLQFDFSLITITQLHHFALPGKFSFPEHFK